MSEDNAGATETPAEEKKTVKLTDEQWATMRARCEVGDARPGELAREYGVSASAVSQHFQKYNVRYASMRPAVTTAAMSKASEKIAETTATFAHRRIERIEETKSQHYQYTAWITQETMKLMADAKKSGSALSTVANDIKTLRLAAQTISITRQERYAVLEADSYTDEEELPMIEIRDLTEEQISIMRDSDPDEDLELGLEDDPAPEIENEIVEIGD